jgi:hypothetical protein
MEESQVIITSKELIVLSKDNLLKCSHNNFMELIVIKILLCNKCWET